MLFVWLYNTRVHKKLSSRCFSFNCFVRSFLNSMDLSFYCNLCHRKCVWLGKKISKYNIQEIILLKKYLNYVKERF